MAIDDFNPFDSLRNPFSSDFRDALNELANRINELFALRDPIVKRLNQDLGGQTAVDVFPVKVYKRSGSPGTVNTPATWKYEVRDFAGNVLGQSDQPANYMTPEVARPPFGRMLAPPQGSPGLARIDSSAAVKLWHANEIFDPRACP
jgi:hypothetical protein